MTMGNLVVITGPWGSIFQKSFYKSQSSKTLELKKKSSPRDFNIIFSTVETTQSYMGLN